jgi:hypothetical protein
VDADWTGGPQVADRLLMRMNRKGPLVLEIGEPETVFCPLKEHVWTRFVSVSSIAERFKTRSTFVARHLKQRGAEVVEISLPGKRKKLFARKGPVSEKAMLGLRVS